MAQKHDVSCIEKPMTVATTEQGPQKRYRRLRFPSFDAVVWAEKNPLLQKGELGHEKDTGRFKVGDGVMYWLDLPYNSVGEQGEVGPQGEKGDPAKINGYNIITIQNGNNIDLQQEEDILTISTKNIYNQTEIDDKVTVINTAIDANADAIQKTREDYMDADTDIMTIVNAHASELTTQRNDIDGIGDQVSVIESEIPDGTSSTNQLVNKQQLLDTEMNLRDDIDTADSELQTQINAQATAITNLDSEKLDKNQGVINAGKVMTVGEDGIVVPSSGGSSGLSVVSHDSTLIGTGTDESPLGIASTVLAEIADKAEQTTVETLSGVVSQNTTNIGTLRTDVDDLGDQVSGIEGKIPETASDTNHLITKQQLLDEEMDIREDMNQTDSELQTQITAQASAIATVDSNAVHKTGNETISGTKTFKSALHIYDTTKDIATTPTTNRYWGGVEFRDTNGVTTGYIRSNHYTSGRLITDIQTTRNINGTIKYANIGVAINQDGTVVTECPKPPSTSNDTQIATTAWVRDLFETLYPVGSLYITSSNTTTCPLASIVKKSDGSNSTWKLVSSGRALWTGTGSNGNSTIAAGLPNITGKFTPWGYQNQLEPSGVFSQSGTNKHAYNTGDNSLGSEVTFDASKSNSIYGKSSTVQPPAYVVNVWRRTA